MRVEIQTIGGNFHNRMIRAIAKTLRGALVIRKEKAYMALAERVLPFADITIEDENDEITYLNIGMGDVETTLTLHWVKRDSGYYHLKSIE